MCFWYRSQCLMHFCKYRICSYSVCIILIIYTFLSMMYSLTMMHHILFHFYFLSISLFITIEDNIFFELFKTSNSFSFKSELRFCQNLLIFVFFYFHSLHPSHWIYGEYLIKTAFLFRIYVNIDCLIIILLKFLLNL